MDTNRRILGACIASMLLIGTVSAQTIYKQVDDEGRVIFTDQPASGSRTLSIIESSPPRAQQPVADNADSGVRAEPARRAEPMAAESSRVEPERRVFVERRDSTRRIGIGAAQGGVVAPATRAGSGDVERAVATYTALNTPMAAQADAVEAARRARLGATKDTVGAVLVVQATPREHEQVIKNSGMDSMYFLWAATFFALAAGLLYVGWQVFRLVLGTAFPRWHVGAA